MNSTNTIFLNDDTTVVNLDGVEMTVSQLKDAVIDSMMFRKHMKQLMEAKQ